MSLIERGEEAEAVGDDGYRRIRHDVIFGRLRPGQKLKLEGLKETYGVSVSTLREILSRLTAEDSSSPRVGAASRSRPSRSRT